MKTEPGDNDVRDAFDELERGVRAALETYSNVHRGSGHHSMVSTHLFEQARGIVLDYLGLSKRKYVVIFGSPRTAGTLAAQLEPGRYRTASSRDVGVPLGVRALAVERRALPKSVPFLTGGGTARLVSADWVMWATAPGRFEAGTPAIVNVIAFAKALVLLQRIGLDVILEEEQALTARALLGMARIPGLKIYGIANPESTSFVHKGGVIPFDLKSLISHTVARMLAARGGIGVRSGCHCAHLTVKRMLSVQPWAERLQGLILTVARRFELPGVVRVSLGIENSEEDVDTLIHALDGIARQPKSGSPEKNVRQQMDEFSEAAARRVYC